MENFPPNIDPKISTLTAVIIGFALIGNLTAGEQNAIGNWFITIGQIMENNSAFQQVIEARVKGNNININSAECKNTGNPYSNDEGWIKSPDNEEIERLKKVISIMQEQIDNLSK
ncbi:MAG TPA: hypothetical protein DCE23_08915 [Firmicutes bacterium]|nr:hypothetical protein [Bacillota bacterium]